MGGALGSGGLALGLSSSATISGAGSGGSAEPEASGLPLTLNGEGVLDLFARPRFPLLPMQECATRNCNAGRDVP